LRKKSPQRRHGWRRSAPRFSTARVIHTPPWPKSDIVRGWTLTRTTVSSCRASGYLSGQSSGITRDFPPSSSERACWPRVCHAGRSPQGLPPVGFGPEWECPHPGTFCAHQNRHSLRSNALCGQLASKIRITTPSR
jgi:hypothetical protein